MQVGQQSEFLGNAELRNQLLQMGHDGSLHPCLLFEGVVGIGKATTARWLAQAINCEDENRHNRPCGGCWSCRMIPEGQHPDVIELGPDPDKVESIISVRQARDLLSQLTVRVHSARRRLIIIDPAEAMTVEAANALLKTMEEPPRDTGFILISSRPARLLATVRSRSQRIRFSPVPSNDLVSWLQNRGLAPFPGIVQQAGGGPGRAMRLCEAGQSAHVALVQGFVAALAGSMDGLLAYGESLTGGARSTWRPKVDDVMNCAESLLRDLVHIHARGNEAMLANPTEVNRLSAWCAVLDFGGIERLSEAVHAARSDLGANVHGRLVLDTLLCSWARELGPARKAEA